MPTNRKSFKEGFMLSRPSITNEKPIKKLPKRLIMSVPIGNVIPKKREDVTEIRYLKIVPIPPPKIR
jgi:hypothetical protein